MAQSLESEMPEFVKCDAEKAAALVKEPAQLNAIDRNGKNRVDKEKMAARGFYCYRADDPIESIYSLYAAPQKPVNVKDLPERVRELLEENTLPFYASCALSFEVVDGVVRR